MKRIFIAGLFALGVAALLFVGGCGKTEKRKVVEVKTVAPPPAPEVLDSMDVAMTSRSLVEALRMGEKLDSTYNFHGIFTDGQKNALYHTADGKPGVWDLIVEGPDRVVMRNLEAGALEAEDLRVYIAQAVGLTDSDIIEAGVASENTDVQAVVYKQGKLRMEITLLPSTGADGSELANMSVAFIRL